MRCLFRDRFGMLGMLHTKFQPHWRADIDSGWQRRGSRRMMGRNQMTPAQSRQTAIRPLLALNFMTDMQARIGPFLGVFLLAQGGRAVSLERS